MDRPDLFSLIRRARTPDDLRAVFTALGYAPDDGPPEDGWYPIARWRNYRVLAATADDPHEAVRRSARRLASTARPGLTAALGPSEVAIAAARIGIPQSTPVLRVPRAHPDPAALSVLAALAPDGSRGTLAHALRVAERLASEEIGERFFVALHALLEHMTASLGTRGDDADRRLAVLLTLTRVLFLYFVQAKGWLDGRPDWLRIRLDQTLAAGRHFHRSVLHPLFFGTLNRPPERRDRRRNFGAIPYLNGGLFEPHPVERKLGPIVFPNALWRDAFDELFERFRFSVREADEAGAIAPDMLGRVFERVMDPGERHASGTFYTPEHLVREIVRATVITALRDRVPQSDVLEAVLAGESVSGPGATALHGILRRLRLLDPAVGSGAFLLGALAVLTDARITLRSHLPAAARAQIRRTVLRDNLFGVDRSPIAVRLAELRLWLAVVADDPTRDIRAVAPLPNLDGVVRQGDSLLDPLSAARALELPLGPPAAPVRAVAEARTVLFESRGPERAAAERRLRAAELALARAMVRQAAARLRAALRDLVAIARGRDLFGQRTGLTEPQERRRQRLKRRLQQLRATERALETGTVPFFAFEIHRPETMAAGGFDIVVGNPPWVRAERLDPALRTVLKERFTWWSSGPAGEGFAHLPDLAIAFFERAFELTAEGGAVGLLVPSKLASAGYAAPARAALVKESEIAYLHRVPDREAARFGATTYPLVVIVRKRRPRTGHRVQLTFTDDVAVRQSALAETDPWLLLPEPQQRALRAFLETGQPLAAVAQPALGVKTGADDVFIGRLERATDRTVAIRFSSDVVELERDVVRPAVRGRDVGWFEVAPARHVLWGYGPDGVPLATLPPLAAAYVRRIAARARRRTDHRGGPPWTLFRVRAAVARWRVVWADIARRPEAVVLDVTGASEAVPLNSCYVAAAPDRVTALAIAAVLNSTYAHACVSATADEARGGYRRVNARVAGRLPIPTARRARRTLATLAARYHRGTVRDQLTLDRAVAAALDLPAATCDALAALARDPR